MKPNIKKLLILNAPYLLFVYLFDKVGQAVRLSPGADLSGKLLSIGSGFSAAFSNALPSFAPMDLLIGIVGAVVIRLAVYVKGKNAKKYRKGMEYGSARWGNAEDIKPYIDPIFENNVLLTQTERLMMSSRPKHPKYARNKNVLVIGGSGSGKTRFFVKPNLMQMHSSYVVTDPKGTVLIECGKLLQRGGYKIKVLNTINFKKSMRYNPFAYLRSEKDILKLVNTIIANTKGDGEKSGEDFWVKSERLFYCALIYQLKRDEATQDLRFEPYDRLIATGHEVDRANYDLVYTAPLTEDMTLNTIWEKFNIDHPKDFKGHSLSVSDIVVLHQNGGDTAHYVDSIGYQQVPEFLKKHTPLIPDEHLTGEKIRTPRGSFSLTDMTAEQMKEAGYGLHHTSDDGKYHIMGNGTRAFAIAAEPPEKTNPLKHIEDTVEQNDNNFDGIINNTPQTPTVGELEQKVKAGEPISLVDLANAMKAEKAQGKEKSKTPARREEKPSIREQLKKAKETAAPKKAAKQKNHDLEV